MKNSMKRSMVLGVVTAAFLAGPVAATAPETLVGTYVSIDGHNSRMVLRKKSAQYEIALYGGALKSDGMSTGGDCEAYAIGRKTGDLIKARLVPFEGETMSIDAEGLSKMNRNVLLSIQGRKVVVKGDFSYCGLQVDLSGTYRKE